MDTTPVTVFARARARSGAETELRDLLLTLVAPTRQEPGCLQYEFYQSTDDPLAFAFIETWRSPADLERHLASPHLQGVLLQAMGLIAGAPEITQWNAVR